MNANIDTLNLLLAYAGMLIHFMMKLGSVYPRPDFSFRTFMRHNIFPMLISIVGIPMLLIIATDPAIQEVLPINKATAMLCGWQTQSVFKTIFEFYQNKKGFKEQSDVGDDNGNQSPKVNNPPPAPVDKNNIG